MKSAQFALLAALFGVAISAHPAAAAETAPQVMTSDSAVAFVSGGVGDDERQKMESLAPGYPLQLLFAAKGPDNNEFLADVKVRIMDKAGKTIVDTVAQGPFLLAKIPAGNYTISADNAGVVKQQTVQIAAGKPRRVVFLW